MLSVTIAAGPALAGSRDIIIATTPNTRSAERVLEIPQACDPRAATCTEPEIEWRAESVIYAESSKRESAKPDEAAETAERDDSTPDETIDEYRVEQVTVATVGTMAPARARAESPGFRPGPVPASAYLPSMVPPSRAPSAPPSAAVPNPSYLRMPIAPLLPR